MFRAVRYTVVGVTGTGAVVQRTAQSAVPPDEVNSAVRQPDELSDSGVVDYVEDTEKSNMTQLQYGRNLRKLQEVLEEVAPEANEIIAAIEAVQTGEGGVDEVMPEQFRQFPASKKHRIVELAQLLAAKGTVDHERKRIQDPAASAKDKLMQSVAAPCSMTDAVDEQWMLLQREFSCQVCLDVMAAPCLVGPCGHSFCGGCLDDCVKRCRPASSSESLFLSHRCPACRGSIELALFERHMDRLIDDRMRYFDGKNYMPCEEWKQRRAAFLSEAKQGQLEPSVFRDCLSLHSSNDDDDHDDELEQNVAIFLGVIVVIIVAWRAAAHAG